MTTGRHRGLLEVALSWLIADPVFPTIFSATISPERAMRSITKGAALRY